MDTSTQLFDIIARHLEMDEHGRGRYINKYLPPDKVGELLKELWRFFGEAEARAKLNGQKEMLTGTSELFEKIVEEKRKEIGMMGDELRGIKSYFNWEREFEKKNK